ncbi:Mannose-6-phosphate isomerase [Glutinoglossum americanum]|uniref:Mannose-6-phosphate isomerase n=1 Tax=Glutinoglossum americanum TaxID=1670608 RepID=A0A9P8IHR4_9PEZI|nr:Mannose-6-phosphate isomerase [Glutinoglossum americanum]
MRSADDNLPLTAALSAGVNSYDWGKIGKDSAAARFATATASQDFSIQEEKPYSELWMGTHPSLPSRDVVTQRTLLDLVKDNQALISPDIAKLYGEKLPFLLKVLSINKALSIQAHPDKKLAEQLHARDSKNYPDDNHKPEMAIAVTSFDGLCGFRPLAEISHFLSTIPSLRSLVGDSTAAKFESTVKGQETSEAQADIEKNKAVLKEVFRSLTNAQQDAVASSAKELVASAKQEGDSFAGGGCQSNTGKELAELVGRLNGQFPEDVGLFMLFFLNYVNLEPGEGMFLQANVPHAYLSGDIIECMASSDNVVRAGFTPKFKDAATLISMLTYSYAPIEAQKMSPSDYPYATLSAAAYSSESSCVLYDPPIEEFSVAKTDLKREGAKATLDGVQGPSIVICTQGEGKISVGPNTEVVKEGYVFFVGATAEVVLESTSKEKFVTFKAFCESNGKEEGRL